MIQLSVASLASRLSRMVGSATLTIVVSSRAMNMPAMRTTRARHALRGTVGACRVGVVSVMGEIPSGCLVSAGHCRSIIAPATTDGTPVDAQSDRSSSRSAFRSARRAKTLGRPCAQSRDPPRLEHSTSLEPYLHGRW